MTDYAAPIADMRFAATRLAGLADIAALPGGEELSEELIASILEEGGKFAGGVLAPLNRVGDLQGSRLENGVVVTPDGWAEAYRAFIDGGWNGVPFSPAHGGQGLPWLVATALQEMWHSANMAFGLCPMLTQAGVEAISRYGSPELKATFLPKLVSGEWTGTMVLTEPRAGSDLAAIRARAVREGDHYRITGQKIFITYGDHELTENIVHLVLARLPDAPAGVKGISLFVVPKHLIEADGSVGERNDVRCVSLEHKMGIHASPTAVLSFGDHGGAYALLVGEENEGLPYMFTTMNNARLSVGLQGVAIAERALRKAAAYARERVQGRDLSGGGAKPAAIIRHPDVRRMLLTMRALAEASRALAYFAAGKLDIAGRHPDPGERRAAQGVVDLLIPVVKGWSTEIGSEAASIGVQVHGGMGYIEETGAAQHLRDARIAPIYEGTNGIQAMDLIGRKLSMDGGAHWKALFEEIDDFIGDLPGSGDLAGLKPYLEDGLAALRSASVWIHGNDASALRDAAAGAQPYLRLFGSVVGGWLLARQAVEAARRLAGGDSDTAFLKTRISLARFFAEQLLPPATALLGPITRGSELFYALDEEDFAA